MEKQITITEQEFKYMGKVQDAQEKTLKKINRLLGKIEDMKYDCDGEVYDALLDIFDTLNV